MGQLQNLNTSGQLEMLDRHRCKWRCVAGVHLWSDHPEHVYTRSNRPIRHKTTERRHKMNSKGHKTNKQKKTQNNLKGPLHHNPPMDTSSHHVCNCSCAWGLHINVLRSCRLAVNMSEYVRLWGLSPRVQRLDIRIQLNPFKSLLNYPYKRMLRWGTCFTTPGTEICSHFRGSD